MIRINTNYILWDWH